MEFRKLLMLMCAVALTGGTVMAADATATTAADAGAATDDLSGHAAAYDAGAANAAADAAAAEDGARGAVELYSAALERRANAVQALDVARATADAANRAVVANSQDAALAAIRDAAATAVTESMLAATEAGKAVSDTDPKTIEAYNAYKGLQDNLNAMRAQPGFWGGADGADQVMGRDGLNWLDSIYTHGDDQNDSHFNTHFRANADGNSWARLSEADKWYNRRLAGRAPAGISAALRLANAGRGIYGLAKDDHRSFMWNAIAKLFKNRRGYQNLMGNKRGMRTARSGLSVIESLLMELLLANAIGAQSAPGALWGGVQSARNAGESGLSQWGAKTDDVKRAQDALGIFKFSGDHTPDA